MTLPVEFIFSQGNLHDYLECQRRFQLRYLQKLAWPAVTSEPVIELEKHMRRGQAFHHLAQQYWSGIPSEKIARQISDPDLWSWWQSFDQFASSISTGTAYPEVLLTAPLAGYRILAKFDLLVVQPDGAIQVFDWKTSRHRTSQERLLAHPQTRIYRWMAVTSTSEWLDGLHVKPDQVSMTYWFANDPTSPEYLAYTTDAMTADERYLKELIEDITLRSENAFELTSDNRSCQFCQYRSLCDRGISAGLEDDQTMDDAIEMDPPHINLNQIDEVAF